MQKSVLVTGANGFIGRHTARKFSNAGFQVWGIGHGNWAVSDALKWGVHHWLPCDISVENLLKLDIEPDVVVNCVGSGSVGKSLTFPLEDFDKNVVTISAVLEYIRLLPSNPALVHLSSAAVYGAEHRIPIKEESVRDPISPYGVHKRMSERLVQMHCDNFGLRASIIRFFSVYGTELRKQLLWDASRKLENGAAHFFGTGNEIRDWIHVEDATDLILLASEHVCSACPCVNGGSGNAIDNRWLLETLSRCYGMDLEIQFSNEIKTGDPYYLVADVGASEKWGWSPRTQLIAGLQEYANWYRAQ